MLFIFKAEYSFCVHVRILHILYPFICWRTIILFPFLAIASKVAINMNYFLDVQIVFPIPGSEMAGSRGSSIITLGEIALLFSMLVLIYILTNIAQGFSFFHTLMNTCYLLTENNHLNSYDVIFHCSFDCSSPVINEVKQFLTYLSIRCVPVPPL